MKNRNLIKITYCKKFETDLRNTRFHTLKELR